MSIDTILVAHLMSHAKTGFFDGAQQSQYFLDSKGYDLPNGAILIFTRDAGMHSCGWWKNPDYERCYHLSISYRHILTWEMKPQDKRLSFRYVKAFYGDDYRMIWTEPPLRDYAVEADCWHYRLFCDEHWQPIKPRGEVYSRELTEAGYKTFSEIQGEKKDLNNES